MAATAFSKFVGTARWAHLIQALKDQSRDLKEPAVSSFTVCSALLLALAPVGITLLDNFRPRNAPPSTLPTVTFGICAILAFLFRSRLKLPFATRASWKESLELTHIGVALGCIPAVLVFIFQPNLLAERHDALVAYVPPSHGGAPAPMSLLAKISLIMAIAAWVSLTEEVIFRGFLVSAIRRWNLIRSQRTRDIVAIVVSTIIFGMAHFPTWGPYAATALTGLGLGFVIGYIANGEKLLPLIVYHLAFDALSLFVATH